MPPYFRLLSGMLGASLLLSMLAPVVAQQPAGPGQAPGPSSLLSELPFAPDASAANGSKSNRSESPGTPVGDGPGTDASSGLTNAGPARIGGTVTDTNGDIVPGATVVLNGGGDHRSITANDNASFEFDNLQPGVPYHVIVQAKGFADWQSAELRLGANEFQFVTGVRLQLLGEATSVIVRWTPEEIATEQVHIEEQQRVLGFIPNFYVVYDSKNAVPLTTKLKFELAYRTSIDPITLVGSAFLAGVNQAADTPDYQEGWTGYGERFGAVYGGGVTDILFGGAILPVLLHQDPRYFYKGTGTTKSRMLYALATPFICKGDNGKWQPNYSSVGGDLISSAISNAYYPAKDRGVGYTFGNFAINTAQRAVANIFQEFVVRKLTPSAKKQHN
ncbi:MAG: carboxypeptidase-like regulatory domain-containing protein [Terracidiphilus sp.]